MRRIPTSVPWRPLTGALVALAVALGACSSDDPVEASSGADATTTTARPVPDGPAAELSPLDGGDGAFIGAADPFEPGDGFVEEEFAATGTAVSYTAAGELTGDGRWDLEPGPEAAYRTRVLVRRPADPEDFSGTAVVEWLNVSGGVDADVVFTSLREEILREGHAWVGVSAQVIGVEGGPVRVPVDGIPGAEVAGLGLTRIDPARYGDLDHPGDAFANDIFTQVARAVRSGDALGGTAPGVVVAAGESQSAFALVTYINGVQPLSGGFDGFFVHSRGASAFPVPAPGDGAADLASSLGGTPTVFRTDLDVPVFAVQAENDVVGTLGSFAARQEDSEGFRLWEMAGTSHADIRFIGEEYARYVDCGGPINEGPMHLIVKAAFRHLVEWISDGDPPPEMPRLELTGDEAVDIRRDADGIATGGVRTPPVDVPVEVLSGVAGTGDSAICILSGSTRPLGEDRLAELYRSPADYEQRYADAVDAAIEAGVVLEEDRAAIEAYAEPTLVPG